LVRVSQLIRHCASTWAKSRHRSCLGRAMGVFASSPEEEDDVEPRVSLKKGRRARRRWRKKVDSSLVQDVAFQDGKAMADFAVFLRRSRPDLMIYLFYLSQARFALSFSEDEIDICIDLADELADSWHAYLDAPTGLGHLDDAQEWRKYDLRGMSKRMKKIDVQAMRTQQEIPEDYDEDGEGDFRRVDKTHMMYEFGVAAMSGIHVAVLCHTLFQDAVAKSINGAAGVFDDAWEQTFPDLSLLECLQNSVLTYELTPEGTAYSPPVRKLTHGALDSSFTIEDFCPDLFCQMRNICRVSNEEYYNSICRLDVELLEFGANSKSGSFFFFSHDKKFMLKTAKKKEAETLIQMLPDLIARFEVAPQTLINPFLGLYHIFGESLHDSFLFVVMMNATQHNLPVHHAFDLKGSTHGRWADPSEHVGKDLNFEEEFVGLGLKDDIAQDLLQTHADDVELLRKYTIVDYSVLLEVHDQQHTLNTPSKRWKPKGDVTRVKIGGGPLDFNTPFAQQVSGSLGMQGMAFSVDALSRSCETVAWRPSTGIWSADGRFLYTVAIIDLLTPFGIKPKLEVIMNEVISCGKGDEFSKVPPEAYASRQIELMEDICTRSHHATYPSGRH